MLYNVYVGDLFCKLNNSNAGCYINNILVNHFMYAGDIKNVLRMQGGHKPFSYVAVSFSPEHYLMCSRFCLVWTLLL